LNSFELSQRPGSLIHITGDSNYEQFNNEVTIKSFSSISTNSTNLFSLNDINILTIDDFVCGDLRSDLNHGICIQVIFSIIITYLFLELPIVTYLFGITGNK